MPAATTKADLQRITETEYAKLHALIADLSDDAALRIGPDDVSIKDTIGHRAHWIDLFLGWYADGEAGRPVHVPAEGYKWSELKAYNAKLRSDQAALSWDTVRDMLADRHTALLAMIDATDEAALYGPGPAWTGKWALGRYAEASGASHYRSASKVIRRILREIASSKARA